MRSYLYLTLLVICGSTLLLNCDCNKRLCTNAIPAARLVNFDSASLHAVIVKGYDNDGKFDHLLSTNVYTNAAVAGADTLQIGDATLLLSYYTDYTIEIPALSKTWAIRGISSHNDKINTAACTAGMSYYLNDTLHTIAPNAMVSNLVGYIDISE